MHVSATLSMYTHMYHGYRVLPTMAGHRECARSVDLRSVPRQPRERPSGGGVPHAQRAVLGPAHHARRVQCRVLAAPCEGNVGRYREIQGDI